MVAAFVILPQDPRTKTEGGQSVFGCHDTILKKASEGKNYRSQGGKSIYIFGKLRSQALQKHQNHPDGYFRQKKDIKILSLELNSTLLTYLQAKFEAITIKDVEQVAFLAKAVRHKRFQIKEAITFDSYHLWG